MTGPYDDIISLPHPTSAKHPRMPLSDRAAQFSPFAALSGHGAAIAETARLTDRRIELDEDTRAMLDLKQQILADRIAERPEISVVWFRPDEKKDGGQYVTTVGQLKRLMTLRESCDLPTARQSHWTMYWNFGATAFTDSFLTKKHKKCNPFFHF